MLITGTTSIYLGNASISKVYQGDDLIWPAGETGYTIVPSIYDCGLTGTNKIQLPFTTAALRNWEINCTPIGWTSPTDRLIGGRDMGLAQFGGMSFEPDTFSPFAFSYNFNGIAVHDLSCSSAYSPWELVQIQIYSEVAPGEYFTGYTSGYRLVYSDGTDHSYSTWVNGGVIQPENVFLNIHNLIVNSIEIKDSGTTVFRGVAAMKNANGHYGLLDEISGNFYEPQTQSGVWGGTHAPLWPKYYFYPRYPYGYDRSGLSFWKDVLNSGETYSVNIHRSDDEGEGGGGYRWVCNSGSNYYAEWETNNTSPFTADAKKWNVWANYYDGWTIRFNTFGSFNSGKAIAYRSQESYGGNGCSIATTGINWNNIELAINANDNYNAGYDNFDSDIVQKCPNLKYISLNINGTYTGRTLTLTGSTSWTSESMTFTEYYCPGTTFIIDNNSYWRGIIDWDMAQQRNIIFKDTNGNIITQ